MSVSPAARNDGEDHQTYADFVEAVNMAPADLEAWLDTDESKAVGLPKDRGGKESVGHHSGRRIIEIKRRAKQDLTRVDFERMRTVVGYVHRHLAQRPTGDLRDAPWRHSLMNCGHDPLICN